MKKKIDLSIIIINFNTCQLLKQSLLSIVDSKRKNLSLEVIVVDNNSSDDSVQMIEREFLKKAKGVEVDLIKNMKNMGFAAANNIGIKESKGRYVLLLNPDTQVLPDTLSTMVSFMDGNPEAGVSTCKVELVNGKLDDACHRGFPTPSNALFYFFGLGKIFPSSLLFNGYHLGYQNLNRVHEIDSCVGAFMLIRRKAGEEADWLDEDYFWYGEDVDFCYRVKRNGWKVVFVPDTKMLHWKGASSGMKKDSQKVSTASTETRRRAAMASTDAMRIFYKKHYRKKYPRPLTNFVLLGIDVLEKIRLAKVGTN